MRRNRFWRRHGGKCVFGVGLAVALVMNQKDIGANFQSMNQLKAQVRQTTHNQLQLETLEEDAKAQAVIANERLKRGCTPVVDATAVATDTKGRKVFNLAPIQPGNPVKDRGNLSKLVPGTCVVGAFGDTGIIQQDWTVGAVAVGGDKALVDKNINAIAGRNSAVYRITPQIK